MVGLTVFETTVVRPASLYQVTFPLLQVPDKVELFPEHIVAGLADITVGDVGVGLTLTTTFPAVLLHPAALIQAT
ncbi:hypothetical protein MCERE19_01187 [Spirosomataceae bacterium]